LSPAASSRMSLVNTRHEPSSAAVNNRVKIVPAMRLCRAVAPDIAYTSVRGTTAATIV
jgi:hypothetical protein